MNSGRKDKTKIKAMLKKYNSPILIIYGKLTEITAGGTQGQLEDGNKSSNKLVPPMP